MDTGMLGLLQKPPLLFRHLRVEMFLENPFISNKDVDEPIRE